MDVDMPTESFAEPPAAEKDADIESDDKIKRIQLSEDMARDPEVLQTIEVAQMTRVGEFASSDQISALLSQLTANGAVPGVDALAGLGAPASSSGSNPHAPPFGAGPPSGPQVQPPPGQISAEALEALRSYPPEQVAALVQANPGMAAGLDLAALGLVPALGHGPVPPGGGFDFQPHPQQPQQPVYLPPGFSAPQVRLFSRSLAAFLSSSRVTLTPSICSFSQASYNGYVPPSAQHAAPAWSATAGAPGVDLYNGYKPPSTPAPFGHRHAQSAMPPAPRKTHLRPKKDTPCKYYRMRGRCDWGDKCAFSHDL